MANMNFWPFYWGAMRKVRELEFDINAVGMELDRTKREYAAQRTQYEKTITDLGAGLNQRQLTLEEQERTITRLQRLVPQNTSTFIRGDAENFTNYILAKYGFNSYARTIILKTIPWIKDWDNTSGGGLTGLAANGTHAGEAVWIKLNGIQEEAAVHEFAHAFWGHMNVAKRMPWDEMGVLLADATKAAALQDEKPECRDKANIFLHGEGNFLGFWRDEEALSDKNPYRINTSELAASWASWCMGDRSKLTDHLARIYGVLFQ